MPKIDLKSIPGLQGMELITDLESLQQFLGKLRKDSHGPKKIRNEPFGLQLTNWLAARKAQQSTFFAVHDEPDDLRKNDNWGHFDLFRCIAVRTPDGEIHLLKERLYRFHH